MSAVARSTDSSSRASPAATTKTRDRLIARICLVVALAVAVWSTLELVNLAGRHTTGAELYGVLTAALATVAGAASLVLLRSPYARGLFTVVVLVIWAVVALAGIAGVAAHLIGPVPGHGPIDARPRPVLAPLVFTLLGMAGGTALYVGRRAGRRHSRTTS
jgi:hypothetical protein